MQDMIKGTFSDSIGLMNSVRYINVREISELDRRTFNSLKIIVDEAAVNETEVVTNDRPELAKIFAGARPIQTIKGCKAFQLSWKHYLAYLVTEELVGSNA